MSCAACERAKREPQQLGGVFLAFCDGCKARHIAHSPQAFYATRGKALELVALIEAAFPNDYKAGRELVWNWMKKFNEAKSA